MNNTKKPFLILILILALIPITLHAAPTDLNYRFAHQHIYARNLTTNYFFQLESSAYDYAAAGNLAFDWGPSHLDPPYSGHVGFHEANFGATGWIGISLTYNIYGEVCIDEFTGWTGNCNTTTLRADFGYIKLNASYWPNPTVNEKNFLIRHEFGHTLGMGHSSSCFPSTSVMSGGGCSPMHTTLQAQDIAVVGSWYP